ncbi:MAG TPA: ELWxxDGT repeat protein [Hyphomicrobiaceae bacterium]|nr:ELWxxDGT repeat protein [Hyphomicrobiaceae bacterium]
MALLFFSAASGNSGVELWVTDGTVAGTQLLKDINPNGDSFPGEFTLFNNKLVFQADDGTHGVELWVTDGTPEGTKLLADINPGFGNANPRDFVQLGDKLIFQATTETNGIELWVTDGTEAGTQLLKDINPGEGDSSFPEELAFLSNSNGDKIIFRATDADHGAELWVTDGTPGGTALLQDIFSGIEGSSPAGFTLLSTASGDRLVFSANDGTSGIELYVTDGTPGGTQLIKDINTTGSNDSLPEGFTPLGDKVIFSADDGSTGIELWITDGTDDGTLRLADINPNGDSNPQGFTLLNGTLIFSANDGTTGFELWVTDGTSTQLVKDINTGGDSNPQGFVKFGTNKLLFTADDGSGVALWETDGTAAGTIRWDIGVSNPQGFVVLGNNVIFTVDDGLGGVELWVTDGTQAGTAPLKDFAGGGGGGGGSSGPVGFTPLDGAAPILTWQGDDAAYNDGTNWNLGSAPVSNKAAFFDGTATAFSLTISADTTAGSWIFNSGDYDFTIESGVTVTLDRGGIAVNGGSVIITNDGTFNFAGNSTAGKAQLVNNGIVDFSQSAGPGDNNKISTGSIEGAGNFVLGANQLTVGDNGLDTEVSGTISGTGGSLVKIGAGTLTLSGACDYTGGTIVSDGVLKLGNGGTSGSILGNVAVSAGATFAFDRADAFTFSGLISGAGDVEKMGSGMLVLNRANAYTGNTVLSEGTLMLTAKGAAGTGHIDFENGSQALKLAKAAVPKAGKIFKFANVIDDFGAGDVISLQGFKFIKGHTTAKYNAKTHVLTVTNGKMTDRLTLIDPEGFKFKVAKDGNGTKIMLKLPAPVSAAQAAHVGDDISPDLRGAHHGMHLWDDFLV